VTGPLQLAGKPGEARTTKVTKGTKHGPEVQGWSAPAEASSDMGLGWMVISDQLDEHPLE
jgi:hypothetical protein